MGYFNQDPLEIFFGYIRSQVYRNTSPSCHGFEAAYVSLLINNYSNTHSPGSNCELCVDKCIQFKSLKKLFSSSYTIEVYFDDVNSDSIFVDLEIKGQDPKKKAQL